MSKSYLLSLGSTILPCLLMIYSLWKEWKENSSLFKIIKLMLMLMFASITIIIVTINYHINIDREQKNAFEGTIESSIVIDTLYCRYGYSRKYINGYLTKYNVFALNNNAIKIQLKDGKVAISANLYDKSNKLFATIKESRWKIEPNSIWDRNYSKNAFEIINSKGDVAFQSIVLQDTLFLQCKYYQSNGDGFAIYEGDDYLGRLLGKVPDIDTIKIKPIFKYPSDSFLGKLK